MTRESLLLEHTRLQSRRVQVQAKIDRARVNGMRPSDPANIKWGLEVAQLHTREREIEKTIADLKIAEERKIGRKYAYLCKAIKHELGESTLASFIAEADRLSEADRVAAEVEGYA